MENIRNNQIKLLIESVEKLGDFGDESNSDLKHFFFKMSEQKNIDPKIRDLAIDLMLYCDGNELAPLKNLSKEKIIEKIKATL